MPTPHPRPAAPVRTSRPEPRARVAPPARWAVLAAWCCLGPAGCVNAVRQASETAVPIVVDSGLGELATARSQAQLKSIAASPAVQEAGYGVGLGIGRGILDEGSAFLGGTASHSDEPPPAVGVAATTRGAPAPVTANAPTTHATADAPTTRPAASGRLASVEASLDPMVGRLVRSALTQGLAQASAPDQRAEVRAVAEAAGDGFVSGMSRAADRESGPVVARIVRDRFDPILDDVARRLGPALHDVLQQEVEPVVRDLVAECVRDTLKMPVRPENRPDVIANAQNVSLGAGQGTHDALVNLGVLDPSGRWSAPLRVALWGGATLLALLGLATLLLLYLRIRIAWAQWRPPTPPHP